MVTARQLLDDDVEGERIWDVVRHLLHLFFAIVFILLCEAKLAKLITAPGEELCVLGLFPTIFVRLDKLKACTYFTIVNHFYFIFTK